jgi:hypothetical protein
VDAMKRFAVFAGHVYYPCGGIEDFRKSFDTLDEAIEFEKSLLEIRDYTKPDWTQVIDLDKHE